MQDENFSSHTDTVYKNGKPVYFINILDSNNIIIDNGSNKYHCEKRGDYDKDALIEFLQADSVKKIINGVWFLESADAYPVIIKPDCKNITKGTKVNFNNYGRLELFPIDTTYNNGCSNYICRVALNHVRYISGCVMTTYSIEKLNPTELILKGNFGLASTVKFKRIKTGH